MKKKGYLIKFIACVYIICCLVRKFDEIGAEIAKTLEMWAGVLVPSLFPYLVLSQYVTSSGAMNVLKPIKLIVMKLFRISGCGADVYLCSLVSGYPSGAMCVSELYGSGEIDKEEAQRLVCFTNNAGALFVISAIGGCMLGCTKDGAAIYVIQTLSAMLTAIVTGWYAPKPNKALSYCVERTKPLTKCCTDSVNTILNICGYLVVVTVVGQILMITCRVLPFYDPGLESLFESGIYFVLEITKFARSASTLAHTPLSFAFICAGVSWGGVSVILQIRSCLPKDFSTKQIVLTRFVQGLTSFASGYAYKFFAMPCSLCSDGESAIIFSLVLGAVVFIVGYVVRSGASVTSQ